jgi:hypothetical protein
MGFRPSLLGRVKLLVQEPAKVVKIRTEAQ